MPGPDHHSHSVFQRPAAAFGKVLDRDPDDRAAHDRWGGAETGGLYRLTIQKQPGLLPGPLTLIIRVPEGFRITAASDGLTVAGRAATLQTTFTQDIVLGLRYAPTTAPTPASP